MRLPSSLSSSLSASLALISCVAVLLTGCAKELAPENTKYVGQWRSKTRLLVISQEGKVHYERRDGNARVNIDAPLQSIDDQHFDVGLGPFSTSFKVSRPPHEENGIWRMTVDGEILTRIDATQAI